MKMLLTKSISEGKLRLLSKYLKQAEVEFKVISENQFEDIGLSYLINEADKSEIVSKKIILKKLRK
ncbi:MAG: hypothetical protein ACKOX3_01805 [Bacteroidota bacterium]